MVWKKKMESTDAQPLEHAATFWLFSLLTMRQKLVEIAQKIEWLRGARYREPGRIARGAA